MPAAASITVGGQRSVPPAKSEEDEDDLRDALMGEVARLINQAATLGGDGHYRKALRNEAKAGAMMDVITYLDTGGWPQEGERPADTATPSERLAARYQGLRQ
jgi:hypothetical protein